MCKPFFLFLIFFLFASPLFAKVPVIDSLKAILDTAKASRLTALLRLGNAYNVQGDLDEAIFYYSHLKKESENDSKKQFWAYNNMSVALMQIGQHREAKIFLWEAYQLSVKKNMRKEGIFALINLGLTYKRLNLPDSAIHFFRQAHILSSELNKPDTSSKLNILSGMAEIYMLKNQYSAAYDSLFKSLPMFESFLKYNYNSLNAYWAGDYLHIFALASDYMGNKALSDSLMQEAINMSLRFNMKKILYSCYQAASTIQENRKNYKKALEYYKKYTAGEDTLTDSARIRQISKLSIKFNMQKKDMQIEELNSQKKNQNLLFILTAVLFVSLVIIGLQYLRMLRLKISQKQTENQLVSDNLAVSNKEKQDVLKIYENQAQQLLSYTLMMAHQKETWHNLDEALSPKSSPEEQEAELTKLRNIVHNQIESGKNWQEFTLRFKHVNPTFFDNLQTDFPDITPEDLRLCALLKLNLNAKQIGPMLGIAASNVEINKYRLSKKLGLADLGALSAVISKRK